jgi:predicted ATP-binding protein involved in virulence
MRIQSLKLENFRGFNNLELNFHEDLNVIIGENGAGKSSILDALAVLLSLFIAELQDLYSMIRLTDDDIKNETDQTKITITVFKNNINYVWHTIKRMNKKETTDNFSNAEQIIDFYTDERDNLPLIVYYPVNRVANIEKAFKDKAKTGLVNKRLMIYEESLKIKIEFSSFFEWFKEREDFENEKRLDDSEWRDPELSLARSAITEFTGFTDLRVRRNPTRLEITKGSEKLNVNQLSDGEKCLFAMVGDLARRLAIANRNLENPLEGQGVVLIDEIELHLHPTWQRKIIPGLRKAFPNCQFIVTTHSPQVISHVEAEKISLLRQTDEGIVAVNVDETYGKTSDRILEDIMGVSARPPEIRDDIRELFRYIDESQFEKARDLVLDLRDKIGEDPDLVRAEVLIRRKEIIGK